MNRTFQFLLIGSLALVGVWYLTRQDYRPVGGANHQYEIDAIRNNMNSNR